MKAVTLFFGILLFSLNLWAEQEVEPAQQEPIQAKEVREILHSLGIKESTNDWMVNLFETVFFDSPRISTVLWGGGFNAGFIVDRDTWELDAFLKRENELVRVTELFDARYQNGGLKAELVYKHFLIFIPEGVGLDQLDGAVFYGGALGHSGLPTSPLGVEVGLLKHDSMSDVALVVALKAGLMESHFYRFWKKAIPFAIPAILDPRIEFRQKKLLPW